MKKYSFYKSKRGSNYDNEVKKYFQQEEKWRTVIIGKVAELLGENITSINIDNKILGVNLKEIKNEETMKLFKKNGALKQNSKAAKNLNEKYLQILKDEGLDKSSTLQLINFTYDVMRHGNFGNPDYMERFVTSNHDIYFKADFDLEERSNGSVETINEVEYHEKYLEEVKKRESA